MVLKGRHYRETKHGIKMEERKTLQVLKSKPSQGHPFSYTQPKVHSMSSEICLYGSAQGSPKACLGPFDQFLQLTIVSSYLLMVLCRNGVFPLSTFRYGFYYYNIFENFAHRHCIFTLTLSWAGTIHRSGCTTLGLDFRL